MSKKFIRNILSIVIFCLGLAATGCFFKSSIKANQSTEKNTRQLSFTEALDILHKLESFMDSFKGRVKINFKDKKEGKEKVFICAVVYKKHEFFRLDAYTSLGASFFKLIVKPKAFDLYIPMKNMIMSAELDNLRFLQNKKWRSILPLKSIDLFHLVGIPHDAKPLFMKREIVSKNLYYAFDSGNYGILTFDNDDQTVVKNEQFDINSTRVAQLQYKDYKRFGSLLYPTNISIADYNSGTYIKIDLLNFEPLGFSEENKDFSLKCPDGVRKECVEKIEGKLQRWFIIEEKSPNEQYPANCSFNK
ncbi:DUF4292 domain-containing protein [bacterium]|nr:DUF4292 domain-containing protein [bacterium]